MLLKLQASFLIGIIFGKDQSEWTSKSEDYSSPTPFVSSLIDEEIKNLKSARDFFNFFINDDMMNEIIHCTNIRLNPNDEPVNPND